MSIFNSIYTSESRTAGLPGNEVKSVQAWKKQKTLSDAPKIVHSTEGAAEKQIIASLEKAKDGQIGRFAHEMNIVHAYADSKQSTQNFQPHSADSQDSFEFSDVIDIVNPLHHLPLVGVAFRGITGNKLHPMSQIIGGAIYGGHIGAVTGTINAITKVQTGKDMGDHALSILGLGVKNSPSAIEMQINQIAEKIDRGEGITDRPETAMAFVNTASPQKVSRLYEKISLTNGRTAGQVMVERHQVENEIMPRRALQKKEAITNLALSPMPAERVI